MKFLVYFLILNLPVLGQTQSLWGSGANSGSQGCGYPQTMSRQTQVESDDTSELRKQIKELENEKNLRRRELLKAKSDLSKWDSKLKITFDDDAYSFIKAHFDDRHRCQDYSQTTAPKKDSDDNSVEAIEPKELARDWANVCDIENNPRAKLKPSICTKNYLVNGNASGPARPDGVSCKDAISGYPRAKSEIKNLEKELESLTSSIDQAKAELKESRTQAAGPESMKTEAGLCLDCLASGGGQQRQGERQGGGGFGQEKGGSGLSGLLSNSVMALMAYSSTKDFYGSVSDKNSNLGYPTAMPATSPFMAAAPYIMGAIGVGGGQGSFGCAGQSAGSVGISGNMNAMMGLGSQQQSAGGAFGVPQWAQASQVGGQFYAGFPSTMGNNLSGQGVFNSALYQPAGMGQSVYGQLAGGASYSPYASLGGASGMTGLSALSGISGTGTQQMLQFQLQQQMQYYQTALQRTQSLSGLQTEMSGLIQRIQQVQNGSQYGGVSYQLGTSGGYGGLSSNR